MIQIEILISENYKIIQNYQTKQALKNLSRSLLSSSFLVVIQIQPLKWISKKLQRFLLSISYKIFLQDHLLQSIKEFLEECLIYESLPQNSQVIIVDKSFSCLDTFKVFIDNDCVDCVTWNSDIAFFERILTYTDICEIIVKLFLNFAGKIENRECNIKAPSHFFC